MCEMRRDGTRGMGVEWDAPLAQEVSVIPGNHIYGTTGYRDPLPRHSG
jgi:hypothetical protein